MCGTACAIAGAHKSAAASVVASAAKRLALVSRLMAPVLQLRVLGILASLPSSDP